jgi:hypothetical protein
MPSRALRDEPPVAEHLQLPVIIWVALCGGAVGLGITGIDGFGPHAFTETGKFRLWLFLIGTQTALWALGAGVFQLLLRTSPLADVAYAARRTAWSATAAVGLPVLGFVAVATVASTLDYDLPGHKAKVTILSFLGAGVALMGVHALARVHFALRHKRLPATVRGIEAYLDLRAVIERVLAVEGAILGAAILASGALRNVVVASNGDKDSAFPKEDLLLYGAYFSLILVLVYAPVYQRLVATGRRLVDDACPGEEPSSPDWAASYDKRKKLEQLLELQLTTSGSFRAAVAISAPLVSSIVGLLLGKA